MATIITHFDFLRALFDFGAFLGALFNFSFFLGTLFGFGGAFWFWDAFWLFGCAFCFLGRFLLFCHFLLQVWSVRLREGLGGCVHARDGPCILGQMHKCSKSCMSVLGRLRNCLRAREHA